MKKVIAVVCIATLILGLAAAAQVESLSSGMSVYGAGKYLVGSDIDEGEYVLFAVEDQEASFIISSDAEGTAVISKGVFATNTLLAVANGDCLELSDCIAILARDYYSMYTIKLDEPGGMLKVGTDIEPGVYMISAQEDHPASYRVYQDVRLRLVADEKEFEDNCQVHLKENQYLELVNCTLLGLMPEDDSIVIVHLTPRPVSAPNRVPDLSTSETPPARTGGTRETKNPSSVPTPDASSLPSTSETPDTNVSGRQVRRSTSSGRRGTVLATATPKPTAEPTPEPTAAPTPEPTAVPTLPPIPEPIAVPTPAPTPEPTAALTPVPAPEPEVFVTPEPTELNVPEQLPIDELPPEPSDDEDGWQEDEPEAEPEEFPVEEENTELPETLEEEKEPAKSTQKVRIDKTRTPTIRTEPTTKGKKLGVAKGGMEYELLETEGNWYKILLENGEEGWIISTMAELVE